MVYSLNRLYQNDTLTSTVMSRSFFIYKYCHHAIFMLPLNDSNVLICLSLSLKQMINIRQSLLILYSTEAIDNSFFFLYIKKEAVHSPASMSNDGCDIPQE